MESRVCRECPCFQEVFTLKASTKISAHKHTPRYRAKCLLEGKDESACLSELRSFKERLLTSGDSCGPCLSFPQPLTLIPEQLTAASSSGVGGRRGKADGGRDLTYIFSASALLGGFLKIRARTVRAPAVLI